MRTLAASPMASSSERRASARGRLFILVHAGDGGDALWACDISLGGMQCKTRTPRWPGTYLDLSFSLPDTREQLEVGAQVISLGQADDGELALGLRFCRVPEGAQLAIYRFLDRRREWWSAAPDPFAPVKPRRLHPERYPSLAPLLTRPQPFAALLDDAHARLSAAALPVPAPRESTGKWLLNRLGQLTRVSYLFSLF